MNILRKILILLIIIAMTALISCTSSSAEPQNPAKYIILVRGWDSYYTDNYTFTENNLVINGYYSAGKNPHLNEILYIPLNRYVIEITDTREK